MSSADGIAAVALGLGKTVVEGSPCFRFCPSYPRHNVEFSTVGVVLSPFGIAAPDSGRTLTAAITVTSVAAIGSSTGLGGARMNVVTSGT